jgi:glycosyltransferase involved in cell wall biosynthesis
MASGICMNTPVPILFTIPNFITAGSGRAMLNIIQRLDRARFAPAVGVLKKGGKLDAEVERLGIPFLEAPFVIPAKPYASLLLRAWQAAQVFRLYRFELWHSFHYTEDYTEPLIAYLAGARAWVYTKKNMNWGTRAWWLRSFLARRIAAQNRDMLARFFSNWPLNRKTRLLPRGVDAEKFTPTVPARLGLRARLGIPHDAPLIACVAELLPVKGHPILLDALVHIPKAHLLLAGRPMDEAYAVSLEGKAGAPGLAGRAHFLGGVEDIPALLAESDLFVLPTLGRGEGCPVALLEAMSSGKACIATDIPGSRDLIVHRKSGWLVPPEAPLAMTEAIHTLIRNKGMRSDLGQAARRRVEEYYILQREVEDHVRLYEELLGTCLA